MPGQVSAAAEREAERAVYEGETMVEGISARRVAVTEAIRRALGEGVIPVIVDPQAAIVREIAPFPVVDAIMAKRRNAKGRVIERYVALSLR